MIDSTQFLKQIKNRDPHLGLLLEQVFDQLDTSLGHLGVSTRGKVAPPTPLAGINVAAGTDHVHVTLTDSSQVNKNVQYFVEYSVNDPSFAQPHVEHLGASRGRPLSLPAKDNSGTPVNYYFRAYSQMFGSDAQSEKAYFGSAGAPTAVTLSGSSKLTLLPSTGSGTGRADGTQGGVGLGTVLERPAPGPKRAAMPKPT
jgi:hypothetical protein